MGEARRRKLLDPNYGKQKDFLKEMIQGWDENAYLIFFREEDKEGKGGDIMMILKEAPESFSLIVDYMSLKEEILKERYLKKGKGIVSLIPRDFLKFAVANIKKPRSYFSMELLEQKEIDSFNKKEILLGNISLIKPTLLWCIDNYNPEKEIIYLFCGFPLNMKKTIIGLPPICYGILRANYKLFFNLELNN